jgi:DNA-directed RNA polymerase subunit RPC12/RpoP
VNRMVCEDCATIYFSAAARTMVARGERCSNCGGRLVLADAPRPVGATNGEGFGNDEPGGGDAAA